MKRIIYGVLCVLSLFILAACTKTSTPLTETAPLAGDAIPGQYIVKLKTPPGLSSQSLSREAIDAELGRTATSLGVENAGSFASIRAFVTKDVDNEGLARLKQDPRVAYVEQDRVAKLYASQKNPPSWGLDRIDQRALPLNKSYNYTATGQGVTAYIVDSGIKKGLSEWGSRLVGGISAVSDGRGFDDCFGHGSHVAGTVGGSRYGVAKNVKLFAVRVFGCRGETSNSTIISGLDWVHFNHVSPAVVNLSAGSTTSAAMDEAARNLIEDGVMVVVAAGNERADACKGSPGRVPGVLTVAAANASDRPWLESNRGKCIDLYAPGQDIVSTSLTGAALKKSGTSMATPHVTGVVAQYLQKSPTASPATIASTIISRSTKGKVRPPTGTPDRLLFSGF